MPDQTSDPTAARLQNLRRALAALPEPPDALLITAIDNLGYVTGFTGSTAQAVVTADAAILITDSRYTLRAQAECRTFNTVETPQGSGGYGEALQNVLKEMPGVKRLGFEAGHVSVAAWEKFKALLPDIAWVGTAELIETLRLVKDAGEIAAIQNAIRVAEEAFLSVKHLLKPGTREQDFALELEFAMRRGGASGAAFDTIVASGGMGAHPHHQAGPRPLAAGDFVTIDWGASVGGYCSDITRTVVIGGQFTPRQQEAYSAVLAAQQAVIAGLKPGITGKDADALARDFLTERGLGAAFSHSTGHGLGREVHDGGGLSVRSEGVTIAPGQVWTVEPGAYLADWGGLRLEEDVLVTADGCEVLTTLPRDWAWATQS